jgi:hypothetical protein
MVQYQQSGEQRDPRTPIAMQDRVKLPIVWFVIMGLVIAGFIANFTINIFASGGLSVWPVVIAVVVLLVINQASDENAVGVPPLQAYGLFFGVLLALFAFVFLVSKAINPWVIVALTLGVAVYVGYDWVQRKRKQLELNRRRLAGLCVRCLTPVKGLVDENCPNCDLPVNQERLDLIRLGRAIANKAQSGRSRQVLTGQTESKGVGHKKMQNLQQQRAYKYKKGK